MLCGRDELRSSYLGSSEISLEDNIESSTGVIFIELISTGVDKVPARAFFSALEPLAGFICCEARVLRARREFREDLRT